MVGCAGDTCSHRHGHVRMYTLTVMETLSTLVSGNDKSVQQLEAVVETGWNSV